MTGAGAARGRGGASRDAALVLGGYLLLGVLAGVLWWAVVDLPEFTRTEDGSLMGELESQRRFTADGWFAVIALVLGLVAGGVLTWWRDRDPRWTVLLVVVGAAVASATMALTGAWVGPDDPGPTLRAAEAGTQVPAALRVTAVANYLLLPIGSLLGALVVLWSSHEDA